MVDINKLVSDPAANVKKRPTLEVIARDGALSRPITRELYRMFYVNGPGNGTMLSLPFDQLVEHGIGHTLLWDRSADPRAVIELANRGCFSLLALSIGQAEKYQNLIRPDLPLLVKVDGHFLVGKEVPYPRHSTMSSVERAVKAGADAIGFTFYIGGEETERDAERVAKITEEAHSFGKPVFMWAYARGPLPEKMGADSLFWCAQGISAGESLGVDVVKQKYPAPAKNMDEYRKALSEVDGKKGYYFANMPKIDQLLALEPGEGGMTDDLAVKRLSFMAEVAPNVLKIISGGPKGKEDVLYRTLKQVMDSGNEGQIVGRNLWGRPIDEALDVNRKMVDIMRDSVYKRALTEERYR